jgi:hypothetical protein
MGMPMLEPEPSPRFMDYFLVVGVPPADCKD